MNGLMKHDEVAQYLGIKTSTLWKWIREGMFPPPDIRRHRFSRYTQETFAKGIQWLRTGSQALDESTAPDARLNAAVGHDAAARVMNMRGKLHTRYSQEQKAATLAKCGEMLAAGKSVSDCVRDTGIPDATLRKWLLKLEQ